MRPPLCTVFYSHLNRLSNLATVTLNKSHTLSACSGLVSSPHSVLLLESSREARRREVTSAERLEVQGQNNKVTMSLSCLEDLSRCFFFLTVPTVHSTRNNAGFKWAFGFSRSAYRPCNSHLETMHKDSHMKGMERESSWHKLSFTLWGSGGQPWKKTTYWAERSVFPLSLVYTVLPDILPDFSSN